MIKRMVYTFGLLAMLFAAFSQMSYATSWVGVPADEVIKRAEVIVAGTYNFGSKGESGKMIFHGRRFEVERVYRGDAEEVITAGIDMFDIGWVDEHQRQGGSFLLFLEHTEMADFLVPIAGPNGMIQLQDGKVARYDSAESEAFQQFLDSHAGAKPQPRAPSPGNSSNSDVFLAVGAGIAVFVVVVARVVRGRKYRGS